MDRHEYLLARVKAGVSAIQKLVETMPVVALKSPMPARAHYIGVMGMQHLQTFITTLNSDLQQLESEIDDLVDEES